jgi:predicted membrane-bound spermidine synthase
VSERPVERTIKYATTVPALGEAWTFVMGHLDEVGPDPSIEIRPMWTCSDDDETRRFEVAVSGMVAK